MRNPFEYGRELGPGELADRETEVAEVRDALLGGAKHFLIGPRRYGKSSVHNVGAHLAREAGGVVLRYNAEAYERLELLLAAIVADTARLIPGPVQRAGAAIERFFGALRPKVSFNPVDQSWSASLGAVQGKATTLQLVEVLHGLERAAVEAEKRVGLVVDEVQHLVAEGVTAERQLRAAVQEHKTVGYVFAGSDSRLLHAMLNDAERPFYRLGTVRVLDAIPPAAFRAYLHKGFALLHRDLAAPVLDAILDDAEHVPYNVQLLAHQCWNALRDDGRAGTLDPARVRTIHRDAAIRLDPIYSQLWLSLSAAQRRALQQLVQAPDGTGLHSQAVTQAAGLTASGMQKALDGLVSKRVAWVQARAGTSRLRLEDPLFGVWVRTVVAGSVPAV